MSEASSALAHNWSLGAYVLAVVALCLFMIGASRFLGGKAWGRSKNEPFESGVAATGSARLRLSAKFYLVAMLFLIFEAEALFLYAWAVSIRETGWTGFIGAAIFIGILFVGLIYESSVGALDWTPEGRRKRREKSLK